MKAVSGLLALFVGILLVYGLSTINFSSLPYGHDHAPDGVYFLRAARTIQTTNGPVRWGIGQQLFADRLSKITAPEGMVLVTDGTHSEAIPSNMLSQDVQEGAVLRQAESEVQRRADTDAQAKRWAEDRAAQERARQRELEAMRAPTPKFGHTALDQGTTPVQTRSGGYPQYYYVYPNGARATPTP